MQPSPASITTRKFAHRLLGLDASAVYQFLSEIAVALDHLQSSENRLAAERDDARTALRAATARAEAAAQQAAGVEARLRSHQEREASVARALILAEEAQRDIQMRAQAAAEATTANAQADATEIIKSARQTAAKIMEDAREVARHALEGARRFAEAKSALAGVESRLLIEESSAVAARIGLLTKQQTATLTAQVEAIVAEHNAPADTREEPERFGELKSELDQAMKLIMELEARLLPQGPTPTMDGEHEHS